MDERVLWVVAAICLAAALVHLARRWRYDLPRDRFVEGRVLRVGDGDGLEIRFRFRGTRRVRLAYVDAPELDQLWGAEAQDALSRLVGGVGGRVEVKAVGRDRHGRLVVEVRAESVDVNATLVEEGHAWAYERYIPAPCGVAMWRPRRRPSGTGRVCGGRCVRPRPGSGAVAHAKACRRRLTDRSRRMSAPVTELRRAHSRRAGDDTVRPDATRVQTTRQTEFWQQCTSTARDTARQMP